VIYIYIYIYIYILPFIHILIFEKKKQINVVRPKVINLSRIG